MVQVLFQTTLFLALMGSPDCSIGISFPGPSSERGVVLATFIGETVSVPSRTEARYLFGVPDSSSVEPAVEGESTAYRFEVVASQGGMGVPEVGATFLAIPWGYDAACRRTPFEDHKPMIENAMGLTYDRPAQHMREYLTVTKALIDEGRVDFDGQVFQVRADLEVNESSPVPIVIAALAPRMLRMAGELVDGTVTWMAGVKTIGEHIVPRIQSAAHSAGRSQPRVVVGQPVAVTDNPHAARDAVAQVFERGAPIRLCGELSSPFLVSVSSVSSVVSSSTSGTVPILTRRRGHIPQAA